MISAEIEQNILSQAWNSYQLKCRYRFSIMLNNWSAHTQKKKNQFKVPAGF